MVQPMARFTCFSLSLILTAIEASQEASLGSQETVAKEISVSTEMFQAIYWQTCLKTL